MDMQQIENTIKSAIVQANRDGIKIVTNCWGIRNINGKWICTNGVCSPLAAVLLYNPNPLSEDQFSIGYKSLFCQPHFALATIFKVNFGWLKSFTHGMINSEIGFFSNKEARDLGYKYYQIFVEKKIPKNIKMYTDQDKIATLRERSGTVRINSKLVSFLYQLIRDHVPPGEIEKIVQESEDNPDVTYTNGWLARYAEDLSNRLKDQ